MTLEERILFCKNCLHRKFDAKQGLVCRHTASKPEFDPICPEFSLDKAVETRLNNSLPLTPGQIRRKILPKAYEMLKLQQNMPFAILAGSAVGLCCAILWFLAAVSMEGLMSYLAIAVGIGVGYAVRIVGKGVERVFGICGAVIALLSCLAGKFFFAVPSIVNANITGIDEFFNLFRITHIRYFIEITFVSIDLLFYAIALYTAYRMSFRFITEKTAHELNKKYSTVK